MNQSKYDTDKNIRVNQMNFYFTLLGSSLGGFVGLKLMKGKGPTMLFLGGLGGFALTHLVLSKVFGSPFKLYEGNRDISRKPVH